MAERESLMVGTALILFGSMWGRPQIETGHNVTVAVNLID